MRFPWRISTVATLLIATLNCGGNAEPDRPSNSALPRDTGGESGGVITGKLSPTIAPPSALVVLEPEGGIEIPIKAEPALMDQAGTEFIPGFLLAQTGQAVLFRNSEDVLHNVRVTEVSQQKAIFNVATPPYGKYEHKFDRPGLYNVGCDIHATMRADILVTATPYTANTVEDGSFTMSNVKPGKYNLTVYTGGAPVARTIEVKSGKTDLGIIQ
jgi:plastocyanin